MQLGGAAGEGGGGEGGGGEGGGCGGKGGDAGGEGGGEGGGSEGGNGGWPPSVQQQRKPSEPSSTNKPVVSMGAWHSATL